MTDGRSIVVPDAELLLYQTEDGRTVRSWATQRLREYIIKGFTLDDERLKVAC